MTIPPRSANERTASSWEAPVTNTFRSVRVMRVFITCGEMRFVTRRRIPVTKGEQAMKRDRQPEILSSSHLSVGVVITSAVIASIICHTLVDRFFVNGQACWLG